MCSLNSLHAVMSHISKDQITIQVIPLLLKAMKDPIPNVRFCAAKIVKQARSNIEGSAY